MKLQKPVDYFVDGIPDHDCLMSMIDNNTHHCRSSSFRYHQLLISDDLLCDIVSRKDNLMQKLFAVYSYHRKLSFIMLSQMLFKPGDYKFNVLSENVHHLFLFKSSRNSSKLLIQASKLVPTTINSLFKAMKMLHLKSLHIFCFTFIKVHQKKLVLDQKYFQVKGL